MKLKEYIVTRNTTKSKTVKQMDGSYGKREENYGVTLTFEIEDGEHLADEADIIKEANDKALEALKDLQVPLGVDREAWMQDKPKEKNDGYTTVK